MNKKILGLSLLASLMVTLFILPIMVSAENNTGTTLQSMACKVESAALAVGAPIVVVGWVIAGILWLLSSGAPDKMGIAKKAIFACVVGTILIVLAIGSNAIIDVVANAFGITSVSTGCN